MSDTPHTDTDEIRRHFDHTHWLSLDRSAGFGIADELDSLRTAIEQKDARLATQAEHIDALRDVIKKHHDWHTTIGTVQMDTGDGGHKVDWVEIDLSLEYSDSLLCQQTTAALSLPPPDTKAEAVLEVVSAAKRWDAAGQRVAAINSIDDGDDSETQALWEQAAEESREATSDLTLKIRALSRLEAAQ